MRRENTQACLANEINRDILHNYAKYASVQGTSFAHSSKLESSVIQISN